MASDAVDILYGRNAVREALRARRRECMRLLIAEGLRHDERIDEIVALASSAGTKIDMAPRAKLDELVAENHQGTLLHVGPYPLVSARDIEPNENTMMLALDQLEDPRNVGSLLRTAEATGCEIVVLPEHRTAGITPAVVNASAGAVEHLRIGRETNLVQWLRWCRSQNVWTVGLDQGAENESIFEADVPLPCVLVVGSEGAGLRRLVREHCDFLISIPMYGKIESLNASVAGSLALSEIREFAGLTP